MNQPRERGPLGALFTAAMIRHEVGGDRRARFCCRRAGQRCGESLVRFLFIRTFKTISTMTLAECARPSPSLARLLRGGALPSQFPHTRERLRRRRRRRSSFLLPSFAPHSIPFESLSTTVAIGGSSGGAFPFSSSPTLPGCAAPSFFLPYCHCQDDSDHLSQQAALLLLPSPLLPRRRRRRRRRRRPRLPRPPSPACCWRFRFFYLCWSVRPSDDGSLLPGRVHTAHRRRQRSRQADEQPATPLCLSLLLRRSNPHSATD